ncbi:MAG: multicopper oxidase domain-containing protein [Chloroflexi bacterium]|nr:multicopper oxidase domain-containing protein [Chloroflexota bacterium]
MSFSPYAPVRALQMSVMIGSIVAATLLVACGSSTQNAAGSAAAQVITVKATEFTFGDSNLRVAANKPVRLVVANGGLIEHDWVVDKLPAKDVRTGNGQMQSQMQNQGHGHADQVAAHAAPGMQAWVEFTPTKKGAYETYCSIPGHKDAGMKGTLVVQ